MELSVNLGFRDSRFGISSSRIRALRVGIRPYREDAGLRISCSARLVLSPPAIRILRMSGTRKKNDSPQLGLRFRGNYMEAAAVVCALNIRRRIIMGIHDPLFYTGSFLEGHLS